MMIVGVLNRKKVLGRLSGDNTEYSGVTARHWLIEYPFVP